MHEQNGLRELDAQIAEKLFGWTRAGFVGKHPVAPDEHMWLGVNLIGELEAVPFYSTDGNAMLAVLEKMRELGWNCDFGVRVKFGGYAIFHTEDWDETDEGIGSYKGEGSLPVQVCQSALLALKSVTVETPASPPSSEHHPA